MESHIWLKVKWKWNDMWYLILIYLSPYHLPLLCLSISPRFFSPPKKAEDLPIPLRGCHERKLVAQIFDYTQWDGPPTVKAEQLFFLLREHLAEALMTVARMWCTAVFFTAVQSVSSNLQKPWLIAALEFVLKLCIWYWWTLIYVSF